MNLDNAVVYDIETFPNVFTLSAMPLYGDSIITWEISEYRDDRQSLLATFQRLAELQVPMIGFKSESFDYPVIHQLMLDPWCHYSELYDHALRIIRSNNDYENMIWPDQRFAPQIDLFKIHHFDNKNKRTSLKALEINMRSPVVLASPLEFNTNLTRDQIDNSLRPYNQVDVRETCRFAHYSLPAIKFRVGLIGTLGRHQFEVLNYNDTKIGEKMLEQRLGDDVCYEWKEYDTDFNGGTKRQRVRRSTYRDWIEFKDIIFPYIQFHTPQFVRVLEHMRTVRIRGEDTNDVLKDVTADVGGIQFKFGTGGVHASVERQRYVATDDWIINDIDVEGLYPRIAIVNKLAPEHLGQKFIEEYARIPIERKQHAKGTYQNAALKLAANGAWGKSNSAFSCFYDPKFSLTIPVNGQLMICMLVEWLLTVPTLQLIQANTDGITYRIHREMEQYAAQICKRWEQFTCLNLESVNYSRMWIRDVNNYLAEDTKGKLKQKGAYWYPDPNNYADSISQASPPCWYKDLGNIVSARAAVANMVHGIALDTYIMVSARDPFEYMLRAKVERDSRLLLGDSPLQNPSRYYVAKVGAPLYKISPPPAGYEAGMWKRANGVTEVEYWRVMNENGGQWDERVCTKNKSQYSERRTQIESSWLVAECNRASDLRWDNVNWQYYINEAQKLIV